MKLNRVLLFILICTGNILPQYTWFIRFNENVKFSSIEKLVSEKKIFSESKASVYSNYSVNFLGKGIARNIPLLNSIVCITTISDTPVTEENLSEELRGQIVYIQRGLTYKLNYTPNDSLYSSQWSLERIQAPSAWGLTGSEDSIIVGIIDTGIDYLHPDLSNKIFMNAGETGSDNQGRDKKFNNIDDDFNGFIDDYMGWDFTDRNGFPYDSTGGDYLDWDNNPFDDNVFSHGTSVAGIIGAETNNLYGIAGVAPKVRLMNLRAFDPDGFGEEDDVAAALLYAVFNGAKVINMSFGDNSFSYVLKDVIKYAYSRNVLLVASSGNSSSSAPHYPSGYSEVICVGNSTIDDYVASSSNYGSTLDLVAPGTDILTTIRNSRYSEFSGTSAAAPFVTATAALILSKGNFSNEEVKQIIKSSSDDIGEPGWDLRSGSGRLNVLKAVNFLGASIVKFDFPLQDYTLTDDTLHIFATILSPNFREYSLEYGIGLNPTNWNLLVSGGQNQFFNQKLYSLITSNFNDTVYTLRIKMLQSNGLNLEERVNFSVLRSLPKGDLVSIIPALYGDQPSIISAFYTPSESIVKMFYRPQGNTFYNSVSLDGFTHNNYFVKKIHYGFTPTALTLPDQIYEIYFEITNLAGLSTLVKDSLGNDFIVRTYPGLDLKQHSRMEYSLNTGALYNEPVAVTGAIKNQVFWSDLKNLTKTFLYTLEAEGFSLKDSLSQRIIKDFGDFNGNGKKDILANWGRDGYVLEQESITSTKFTDIIKRENSKSWPVLSQDIDNDGKFEVVFIYNDTLGVINRFNNSGGLDSISSFKNFSPIGFGGNIFDYPSALIEDVTGDGIKELLMTDSDGDVLCYSIINGIAVPNTDYSFSTDFLSSSAYLTSGDFNNDGIKDFALLLQSVPFLDIAKYHRLIIFSYLPDSLLVLHDQAFVNPSAEFNLFTRKTYNTLKFSNLDLIGGDELVIFAFPYSYILQFKPSGNEYIFYKEGVNSNAVFTGDLNLNGIPEVGIPESDSLRFYEFTSLQSIPTSFKGFSITSESLILTWANTSGLIYIFKGEENSPLLLIDSVNSNLYTDSIVTLGVQYKYAVSTNKILLPGNNSGIITVYHHTPAQKSSHQIISSKSIKLVFDQKVKTSILNPEVFNLFSDGVKNPISSITPYDQYSYLLSFQNNFSAAANTLKWSTFSDFYGTPVIPDSISFVFIDNPESNGLYIISSEVVDPYTIQLTFNYPLDSASALNKSNYYFSPSNQISEIYFVGNSGDKIRISTKGYKPMGSIGLEYRLQVKNLMSNALTGNLPIFNQSGSIVIISSFEDDLSKVYVYPSPASLVKSSFLTFANLPQRAQIHIFTVNGVSVISLEEKDGNGGLQWNMRDKNNDIISSGVYFYKIIQVDASGNELSSKIEKFTVIR